MPSISSERTRVNWRCLGYLGHPFRKKQLESDIGSHSVCRRGTAKVESMSMHVFHALVSFSLQRRSLCSLFLSLLSST